MDTVMGGALRSVWTQVALPRLLRRIGARLLLSPNHEVVLGICMSPGGRHI